MENQVVILSCGSSQFVIFVDSHRRTHDEKVAPKWPKYIQQKNSKMNYRKDTITENAFLGGCCSIVYMIPGLPPYKKQENHRKSYMVFYENMKVIESSTEVYGNM